MADFNVGKFFRGFNIFDGEKRGKLYFIIVLLIIFGFIMWSAFIKPTHEDIQQVRHELRAREIHIGGDYYAGTEKKTEQKKDKWWFVNAGPFYQYTSDNESNTGVMVYGGFKW